MKVETPGEMIRALEAVLESLPLTKRSSEELSRHLADQRRRREAALMPFLREAPDWRRLNADMENSAE